MSGNGETIHIEAVPRTILAGALLQVAPRDANIVKGGWPAASVANAAVFEIACGDTCLGQRCASVAGVDQVVLRPPVAAVNEQKNGIPVAIAWNPQIEELVFI